MPRFKRKHSPPGSLPGTLIAEGAPAREVRVTLVSYSPEDYGETEAESVQQCFQQVGKRDVTWINVDGTQDAELLGEMGEQFGFHPLALITCCLLEEYDVLSGYKVKEPLQPCSRIHNAGGVAYYDVLPFLHSSSRLPA